MSDLISGGRHAFTYKGKPLTRTLSAEGFDLGRPAHHGPAVVSRTEAGTRCDYSDLYKDQCAHCKGHTLDLEAETDVATLRREVGFDVAVDRTITARFDGTCALQPFDPNHSIEVGHRIGSTDVGYVCRLCVARLA